MVLKLFAGALCAAAFVTSVSATEPPATPPADAAATSKDAAATTSAENKDAATAPAAGEPKDAKPAVRIARPDEMVCKNEEVTGTRLTRRVCMTRRERDERARADRQTLEGYQRQGAGSQEGMLGQ